jgi:FKBP-type peptidyl-prolyl cis-trans isomerase
VQNGQRFALFGVDIAPREGESVEKTILRAALPERRACGPGDTVDMAYVGTLLDGGAQFDRAAHFKFTLGAGDVIKGWDLGVAGMREGEKARLVVHGKRGSPPEIPGDATLVFEVTLNKILSTADAHLL